MPLRMQCNFIYLAIMESNATSAQPSVAVVILNWNGKDYLQQFLPSVLESEYSNLQIIVADNASTDNSVAFLQQNFPSVRIIQNNSNSGYAGGYNKALQQVDADIYVLLNSDVEVTKNWIQPVVDLMQSDKTIAACQPKILSYNNKDLFEYAGASGGWIDKFGYPFSRGRVFEVTEQDKGQYDDAAPCFWATGAALFIRKEDFQSMHGFDEYFFAHQEEIDLCWRLQLHGKKIFVQPSSVVYHVGGGTLPAGNSRKVYYNFRNNLIMLHKNLPAGKKFPIIFLRLFLDGIAGIKSIFSGEAGMCIAILKAHFGYYNWLFRSSKHSTFKQSSNLSGVYNGAIIWDYFIKKKTRFSEIVKTDK